MSNTTYKVCTLDVWGNSEDGFDVNDQFAAGSIELSAEMSDSEILQKLADEGFLTGLMDETDWALYQFYWRNSGPKFSDIAARYQLKD